MNFVITPEEAQPTASAIAKHLRKRGMTVRCEVEGWKGAPYRTTLVATKQDLLVLVEAQGSPNYGTALRGLARWVAANRFYAELYVAIAADAGMQAGMLTEMKADGIGLLVIDTDNGAVTTPQHARNPALVVTPEPTLRYGECKHEVLSAINKFNGVDRKDGLRDMCELVERETEELALRAVRKGWLTLNEAAVQAKDWSSQIDTLASPNAYNPGKAPVVTTTFKADLHSFRGARNLVDHKVRNKREDSKRQKQFAERMMQGPRLVSELVSLQRRVK